MECKWEGNSYKTNDGRHQAVKTFLIVLTVKFFTLFLPCMATSRVGTAKWPQDNLGKFRSKLHGDDPPRIRGQQVMMDPLDPDGIRDAGNGCWDKSWTWPVSSPSSSSSSLSSSSSSPSSSSESSSISSRYSSWSPSSSSNPSWKVKKNLGTTENKCLMSYFVTIVMITGGAQSGYQNDKNHQSHNDPCQPGG